LFEHGYTSLFAVCFADLGYTAEAAQGCGAGLSLGHAAAEVFFYGEIDVSAQFFFEVGVKLAREEEGCDTT
jgi:hypothetical protein